MLRTSRYDASRWELVEVGGVGVVVVEGERGRVAGGAEGAGGTGDASWLGGGTDGRERRGRKRIEACPALLLLGNGQGNAIRAWVDGSDGLRRTFSSPARPMLPIPLVTAILSELHSCSDEII